MLTTLFFKDDKNFFDKIFIYPAKQIKFILCFLDLIKLNFQNFVYLYQLLNMESN